MRARSRTPRVLRTWGRLDASFEPLLRTPSFPEHTSRHSVASAVSRLYGGIHYSVGITRGLEQGR